MCIKKPKTASRRIRTVARKHMYGHESLNLLPVANGLGKDNVVSTDGKLGELRDYYVSPDKPVPAAPAYSETSPGNGCACLPAWLPATKMLYTSSGNIPLSIQAIV